MEKRTFVSIVVVCVILAGGVLYAAFRPAPARAPAGTADTAESPGTGLPALGYAEHGPYYDIAANYPTTTPLLASVNAPQNAAAIALMRGFVGSTIDEFKAGGNPASSTSATGENQGRKESLQINYLIASSPRTVSYIFTVYEDTLGAHENIFFRTFTFDTKTGALLSLADLFAPNTPYLDTLSSISRAELPGIIGNGADAAFIRNGTTPEDKNFENFFVDNSMLTLLFPPYQVGPYAAGPQTLSIPLSAVKSILKPEYR